MDGGSVIDTSFDVRTDARGYDPDSHSPTLRRYHQVLWSKPLPDGAPFDLDAKLHYESDVGTVWLCSDAITHTYRDWGAPARLVEVIGQIPVDEITAFYDLGCAIGAYTAFPARPVVDGRRRLSINQARGMHPRIKDCFDVTLECIRRHYAGQANPLEGTLAAYSSFFGLFGDFSGYVDHFLLNDLVSGDYASVRFYTDFDDFPGDPLPAGSVAEYREYMIRSMDFIRSRNPRIDRYAVANLDGT